MIRVAMRKHKSQYKETNSIIEEETINYFETSKTNILLIARFTRQRY